MTTLCLSKNQLHYRELFVVPIQTLVPEQTNGLIGFSELSVQSSRFFSGSLDQNCSDSMGSTVLQHHGNIFYMSAACPHRQEVNALNISRSEGKSTPQLFYEELRGDQLFAGQVTS